MKRGKLKSNTQPTGAPAREPVQREKTPARAFYPDGQLTLTPQTLTQLHQTLGNRATHQILQQTLADSEQGSPKMHGGTVQRKPADIDQTYSLPFVDGKYQGPPGDKTSRQSRKVNEKMDKEIIAPKAPLIDGHLLKKEYGGKNTPANIVAWMHTTEANYTNFESAYSGKIEGTGQVPFKTKAKFEKKSLGEKTLKDLEAVGMEPKQNVLDTINRDLKTTEAQLERIPTMVKSECQDETFNASGEAIAPHFELHPNFMKKMKEKY